MLFWGRYPLVVLLLIIVLTKDAGIEPFATIGTGVPVTPAGHPVPSGWHPALKFACMIKNEGMIESPLIWLRL